MIPRNVRLAEAPSFGKPILLYDVQSVGAKSYLAVAQELIARGVERRVDRGGRSRRTRRSRMSETKRLGRGLEALLGPVSREQAEASGALRELPVAAIRPNPYPAPHANSTRQRSRSSPRSIEASGLLQPVVVRPHAAARTS